MGLYDLLCAICVCVLFKKKTEKTFSFFFHFDLVDPSASRNTIPGFPLPFLIIRAFLPVLKKT